MMLTHTAFLLPLATHNRGYRTGCTRRRFRQFPADIPARAGFWSSFYAPVPDGTVGSRASVYVCRWRVRYRATLRVVIPSSLPAGTTPADSPVAGDHIRYGAAPNIQTARDPPVGQVTVKFQAQQFFNFIHPRSQSCHGDTHPEDALSGRSVFHCFISEKSGIPTTGSPIPTEGQLWPEQIGINSRFGSEYAVCYNDYCSGGFSALI